MSGARSTRRRSLPTVVGLWLIIAVGTAVPGQEGPVGEEVLPHEMADLAVTELRFSPEFPVPGEDVALEVVVQNRSRRAFDQVDLTLSVGEELELARRIDLPPADSATLHHRWRAPLRPAVHALTAVADPGRELHELEYLDNSRSVEIVVAPRPPAGSELEVVDLGVSAEPGQPVALRAEVRNNGDETVQAPLLLEVRGRRAAARLVTLPPGTTQMVVAPWPSGRPIYELAAELSPRFRSHEPEPANNFLSKDLRPVVDLRVEAASVYANDPQPEGTRLVTLTARVVNDGREPVTGPFRTRFHPGVVEGDDLAPAYLVTDGLGPGESVSFSHTVAGVPGEFEVEIEADPDGIVDEASEENNSVTLLYENPVPNVGRWVSIGPTRIDVHPGYAWNEATGRLSAFAAHPSTPSTLYVGAQGSGVWKTTDGGTTWAPVSDAIDVFEVAALAIDPKKSSRVYLATRSDGLFRSENGGGSWKQISTQDFNAVIHGGALLIDPGDTQRLYLLGKGGIYRSLNGGANWSRVLDGDTRSLVMDPDHPMTLHATRYHKTRAQDRGLYHTIDGGDNWEKLEGCPNGELPVVDAALYVSRSGNQLFVSFKQGRVQAELYRTTDVGCQIGSRKEIYWEKSWSTTDGGTLDKLWGEVWAHPKNPKLVFLRGVKLYRSTDGGTSFGVTTGSHDDHHRLEADPGSLDGVYVLGDGGIYRSASAGSSGSWKPIGEGIANVEFYDGAAAPTDPDVFVGGTQDNGTLVYRGSTTVWDEWLGGDGATVDVDPNDSRAVYGMHQYAYEMKRSGDGGRSWTGFAKGLPGKNAPDQRLCGNFPFHVHPTNSSILLAACEGSLWRTTSSSPPGDWQLLYTPPAGLGGVRVSAVDPNIDLYYAGTSIGRLYAGPGGGNWRLLFVHPSSAAMNDLEFDTADPATFYASFGCGTGNARTGRVWRLTRTTPAPTTLDKSDITSDLDPSLCVTDLAIDPLRRHTVYAATCRMSRGCVGGNAGVFVGRSTDQGTTWHWQRYGYGLPTVKVQDLELHPGSGVLRATTWGRSAFAVYTHHPKVFVEITPETRTAAPNGGAGFAVRVVNTGDLPGSFHLALQGLPGSWFSLGQHTLQLTPGQEVTVPLTIQLPQCPPEGVRTFKVTAVETSDPQVFDSDAALLEIEVPASDLGPDAFEPNDTLTSAKQLTLPATTTQTSSVVNGLTLHQPRDHDYFEIGFHGAAGAECQRRTARPILGSLGTAFTAWYTPGSLSLHVDEEFCRPVEVQVFDAAGKPYGTFKGSDPIAIPCPTDSLGGDKLYLRVRRAEGDEVRYALRLDYSRWFIQVRHPLPDPGLFRRPFPPDLRILDPRTRYFEPRSLLTDLETELPRFSRYRARFEEADLRQLEGLAAQAAGQFESAEELLLESAERFAGLGHVAASGDAWRRLGTLYGETARLEDALQSFARAEELHAEAADPRGRARDLVARAAALSGAGEVAAAVTSLDRALGLPAATEDPRLRFEILLAQLDGFVALGHAEAAVSTLLVLEDLSVAIEDPQLSRDLQGHSRSAEEIFGQAEMDRLRVRLGNHAQAVREAAVAGLGAS